VASKKLAQGFVEALLQEIETRSHQWKDPHLRTVYMGGGTPSLLLPGDIENILDFIKRYFILEPSCEITLEANPDDLNINYLQQLREIGINRLSIGIQSFDNEQLTAIRRRHTAETAVRAIEDAQTCGFDNISIDLIYGLPGQSLQSWKNQIDKALTLGVQHISAYGLTYEKGTLLWHQLQRGEIKQVDDETMNAMYEYLVKTCIEKGFEHYEISNFALPNRRSRHNSAYWHQQTYLGIGPAAHSYNLISRQWNVASIRQYCDKINSGIQWYETEILTEQDKYNDLIMVSLRTSEGIELKQVETIFGNEKAEYCLISAKKYLNEKLLYQNNGFLRLTPDGILISDQIIADLMLCEE